MASTKYSLSLRIPDGSSPQADIEDIWDMIATIM
jgi:hypothetical protein